MVEYHDGSSVITQSMYANVRHRPNRMMPGAATTRAFHANFGVLPLRSSRPDQPQRYSARKPQITKYTIVRSTQVHGVSQNRLNVAWFSLAMWPSCAAWSWVWIQG